MFLLNSFLENYTIADILFYSAYITTAGLITGMSIKRIFFDSNVGPTSPGSGT
jgi:hypothetical protein